MIEEGLNILKIEDSQDNALLAIHQIKKGGYGIYHERVDKLKKLLRNAVNINEMR